MRAAPKLLLLLFATLLLSNCAQTAPPVPPSLELPKPVTDLRVVRKGDKVFLRWTVPTQTTDGENVEKLGPTRICRNFDVNQNRCDSPVGEIPPMQIASAAQGKGQQSAVSQKPEASFADTLPAELQRDPAKIFLYAVAVSNESERSAGLSNKVQISAAATLPAPLDFNAQVKAEGVVLSWAPVASQETAAIHHLYRVYRQQEGKAENIAGEVPMNSSPAQFVDQSLEWEKTYQYRVTVVTVVSQDGKPAIQVEGEDSPKLKVFADDTFPPGVPSGLQAVFSGAGQKPFIDLVWAPNTESDLAGYNVYRHEEGGKTSKINTELVKTPAFRDSAVEAGKNYFYTVSGVDTRGNESAPSEEASEQVP